MGMWSGTEGYDIPPVEGSLGPVMGAADADEDADAEVADTAVDAVVEASKTVLDETSGLPPH